jgi:hypothetical protein
MADIAELGLRIDASGAITATTELKKFAATARDSAQATGVMANANRNWAATADAARPKASALDDSIRRIQADVQLATRHFQSGKLAVDGYASAIAHARAEATQLGVAVGSKLDTAIYRSEQALTKATTATKAAGVGMSSLRGAGTALATSMLGTNAALGSTVGILGSMAIGSGVMAAALLGIAALAKAWELVTRRTREAKETTMSALERLQSLADSQAQGIFGQTGADVATQLREEIRLKERIADLNKQIEGGGDIDFILLQTAARDKDMASLKATQAAIVAGQQEITRVAIDHQNGLTTAARNGANARVAIAQDEARRVASVQANVTGQPRALGPQNLTQSGLDQYRAEQQRRSSFLGAGGSLTPIAVTQQPALGSGSGGGGGGAGIGGVLSQFVTGLQAGLTSLAASFGPLAIAAAALKPVFEGMMEVLGPALKAIAEPLADLGRLIGTRLKPAFEALGWVLRKVMVGISYLSEAFGWLIRGIGKIVNLLPGSPGDPLVKYGQSIIDQARAIRSNTDAVEELTNTLSSGVPQGFRINPLPQASFASMRAKPFSGGSGNITIYLAPHPDESREAFAQRTAAAIKKTQRQDGLTYYGDATAYTRAVA